MSIDLESPDITEQFEAIIASEDKLRIREFLNNQNISDVADLIYEMEDYASQIISSMSIHRAASTFKIIDISVQKKIIQELPPFYSAELLNELPADDRTAFLGELHSEVVKELIKTLDPEERRKTLSLLGYPEGSVGR
ncbi:MAG: magnesium transporter, partial [Chitinophagaceae bacterium]